MQLKKQTSKDAIWLDEAANPVPYKRTTVVERTKESAAHFLAATALKINRQLKEFKDVMREQCESIFNAVMTEKERTKATKGNFTWYNFDASIKVEVSINENIEFDGLLIEKAKQQLMELVSESINSDKDFIKELVLSAFQTSKGKLDTKKVLGLKKHASRITDKRYHEAMKLIDQSIRRPDSKTYFRVWVKDENNGWQNIDLNFSSI